MSYIFAFRFVNFILLCIYALEFISNTFQNSNQYMNICFIELICICSLQWRRLGFDCSCIILMPGRCKGRTFYSFSDRNEVFLVLMYLYRDIEFCDNVMVLSKFAAGHS